VTRFERALATLAVAGVAALLAIALVVVADIVARRTLGQSLRGTIDLLQLGQMSCAFLALPWVFLRDAHIRVDLLVDRLAPRARATLRAVGTLVSAATMAALAAFAVGQAHIAFAQGDRSVTLGVPMLAYWMPVIVGLALALVAAVRAGLRQSSESGKAPAASLR